MKINKKNLIILVLLAIAQIQARGGHGGGHHGGRHGREANIMAAMIEVTMDVLAIIALIEANIIIILETMDGVDMVGGMLERVWG